MEILFVEQFFPLHKGFHGSSALTPLSIDGSFRYFSPSSMRKIFTLPFTPHSVTPYQSLKCSPIRHHSIKPATK